MVPLENVPQFSSEGIVPTLRTCQFNPSSFRQGSVFL